MEYYPIIKAMHIISMVTWMAGMFYLPRLFAYHAGVRKSSGESNLLKIMERRLLKVIINPSMIGTWGFGIWLAAITGYGTPEHPAPWLMYKVGLVVVLSALHGYFAGCVRKFSREANTNSPKFYKFINELVTVIFVAIIFLVVLKPTFGAALQ